MNRVRQVIKNGKRQYLVDFVGADGLRHQMFRPTVEAAEDLLARETIASRQPTHSDMPSTMTLAGYVEHWKPLAAAHIKPRTLKCYEDNLRLHVLPAFGATRLRDLTRARIKTFLAEKLAVGYAKDTVRLMRATLSVILHAAVEDGLIVASPADKLGRALKLVVKTKVRQEAIKAMDRSQRDLFLATAYRVEPWFAPMWEVQVMTGLRPGEVYALQEDDLDLDAATARISRTLADGGQTVDSPKGNRSRTIDLSAGTVQLLTRYLTDRKRDMLKRGWTTRPIPLFPSPNGDYVGTSAVRHAFTRVVKAAKLPPFSPHSLRHTFASLLLVAGTDAYYVSRMLGHASIQETVDCYRRWLPANRKGALDVLDTPGHTAAVTNL